MNYSEMTKEEQKEACRLEQRAADLRHALREWLCVDPTCKSVASKAARARLSKANLAYYDYHKKLYAEKYKYTDTKF